LDVPEPPPYYLAKEAYVLGRNTHEDDGAQAWSFVVSSSVERSI
jgi:hypothetical protein